MGIQALKNFQDFMEDAANLEETLLVWKWGGKWIGALGPLFVRSKWAGPQHLQRSRSGIYCASSLTP